MFHTAGIKTIMHSVKEMDSVRHLGNRLLLANHQPPTLASYLFLRICSLLFQLDNRTSFSGPTELLRGDTRQHV